MSRFLLAALAVLNLSAQTMPTDTEIRTILQTRVDNDHQSVGIVVGTIDAQGRHVVSYGKLAKDDARPLNGQTIFEIGSITKVFTSLILADMVQHGEVSLDDPVAKYLPPSVKVPTRAGRSITLRDLATQTSGLPGMPSNFHPKDPTNPYADYTPEQMFEFISSYELTRDIGSQYEYSNLGVGLLGQALTRKAGKSYEELVRSRICEPLKMQSTRVTPTPEMKQRMATGHNAQLAPVANWDVPAFAGAGALRSDADDMLTFLAANLGYVKTPLEPAMAAMLATRRPTTSPGLEIGLGWHIFKRDGGEVVWHNGGTGGFRTFIGYNRKTRIGVVALANASTPQGVDDIGLHILDTSFPLAKFEPPKQRKEITVDPKIFDGYVGRYELAPNFVLTVTREGEHLFVQATGQPKFGVFPEAEREYFLKAVDAQITFDPPENGASPKLTLHQAGRNMPAKRLE